MLENIYSEFKKLNEKINTFDNKLEENPIIDKNRKNLEDQNEIDEKSNNDISSIIKTEKSVPTNPIKENNKFSDNTEEKIRQSQLNSDFSNSNNRISEDTSNCQLKMNSLVESDGVMFLIKNFRSALRRENQKKNN